MDNYDLFGNVVVEKNDLRKKYVIPPFSILNCAEGTWQNRKNMWINLGIKSEIGRSATTFNFKDWTDKQREKGMSGHKLPSDTSIFDPVLCEVVYKWFVPPTGKILDPFAGGSVRGIVANYLGYKYTGIDLSGDQIYANKEQANEIIPDNVPNWICGDSNEVLESVTTTLPHSNDYLVDFIFSCPPYYDLEVYSDDEGDLSRMNDDEFDKIYASIIKKSCYFLKQNRFACFVVGNVRNKQGYMRDLVGLTIRSFEACGVHFYNDIILKTVNASGSLRADGNMKYRKIVKAHQNVLVFCKGDPKKIDWVI